MKIGLTYTGNPEKHQYYVDWLTMNSDVEIIRLSAADDNLDDLAGCDGLVLSGGVDIHPKFYHRTANYEGAPEVFNEKRDEFEINAYNSAQKHNMPVLGICRGLQLINIIHHGSLVQNLNDDLLNAHKGNPDKTHTITVEPGSLLHGIIGDDHAKINSAHHQAIDNLGDDLIINARSSGGIIEGIERKDKTGKPFLLAIQWHPERMFRFDLQNANASKAIRDRFIEEVKKAKHINA